MSWCPPAVSTAARTWTWPSSGARSPRDSRITHRRSRPLMRGYRMCSDWRRKHKPEKEEEMPAYTVTIVHTVRVVGVLTISARNEDAAHVQAEQMAEQGKFGILTWNITNYDQRIDEWNED